MRVQLCGQCGTRIQTFKLKMRLANGTLGLVCGLRFFFGVSERCELTSDLAVISRSEQSAPKRIELYGYEWTGET